MIDEKKIEEAAKKHMLEQFYSDDDGGDFPCDISDIKSQCMNDFQTGINWFLDNLWHDASEIPKKNMLIYVVFPIIDGIYRRIVLVSNDYKRNREKYHIIRWFYVSDLQKGGTHE